MAKNNKLKVAQFAKARKPSKKRDRILVEFNGPEFRFVVKKLALEAVQEACVNGIGLRGVLRNAIDG